MCKDNYKSERIIENVKNNINIIITNESFEECMFILKQVFKLSRECREYI